MKSMTWAEYQERAARLARTFERLERPDLSSYWWACARLNRDWPAGHLKKEIDIEIILQELQDEEDYAVQLLSETLSYDGAARYQAAKVLLGQG